MYRHGAPSGLELAAETTCPDDFPIASTAVEYGKSAFGRLLCDEGEGRAAADFNPLS
jgi:hypothetical protein